MLLVFSMRLAATIHIYLRAYAPTNILLRHLRTRGGLKWAIPAALELVPSYLFGAVITTNVVADGGPGWLNVLLILMFWNAIRFGAMGAISPVLLALARLRETQAGRRNRDAAAVLASY